MSVVRKALELAAQGIPVFPCRPNDETIDDVLFKAKSPRTAHGFKDASKDPQQLRKWFPDGTDSLIGVPTGNASGLVVVDFDPAGLQHLGSFPKTREHKTRRGVHRVYRSGEGDYPCSAGKLAEGVDFRGENGYAIWWPAHGYESVGDIVPLPAYLADRLRRKEKSSMTPASIVELSPAEFQRAKALLFAHSPDCSEEEWTKCIWSFRHLTNRSAEGLDAVDQWSSGSSSKYPGRPAIQAKWNRPDRDGDIITGLYLGYEPPIEFSELPADDVEPAPKLMFPVTKFRDLVTYKPLPYLIGGLIPQGALGVAFGASGVGKTFFILDAAAKIAAGLSWRFHKTQQGQVFYICGEGQYGFQLRCKAFADARGLNLDTMPLLSIMTAPDLIQVEQTKQIIKSIKAYGGAKLVVIDTLSASTPGADENTKEMAVALSNCSRIIAETGATVILIHHSGKDAARGARGWSGIKAALDFEIEISGDESMKFATVTKMKDGPDGERFGFVLESRPVHQDEDGDWVTSCVVKDITFKQSSARKPNGTTNRQVFETLKSLTCGNSPPSVGMEEAIAACVQSMPYDPQKRDVRRQHVLRSIRESLAGDEFISITDNVITVPQC